MEIGMIELEEEVKVEIKTPEQRIFDLECQLSMLTELTVQLIGELKSAGINVSDRIKDVEDDF